MNHGKIMVLNHGAPHFLVLDFPWQNGFIRHEVMVHDAKLMVYEPQTHVFSWPKACHFGETSMAPCQGSGGGWDSDDEARGTRDPGGFETFRGLVLVRDVQGIGLRENVQEISKNSMARSMVSCRFYRFYLRKIH